MRDSVSPRHKGGVVTIGSMLGDPKPVVGATLDGFLSVSGTTPLMWAVRIGHDDPECTSHGDFEIASALIAGNAYVNATTPTWDFTALHLLCLDCNARLLKLLLDNHASVDAKSIRDHTALGLIGYCGILETEASLDDGRTAIDLLKEKGAVDSRCFVATALYEADECWKVETLRNWRDGFLLTSRIGRGFVAMYYRFGPSLAVRVNRSLLFARSSRLVLDLAVHVLNRPQPGSKTRRNRKFPG